MEQRRNNISQLKHEFFDVVIVGAGINGAVAAASLAADGLKVALLERSDFAAGASSNSSNLIWGGIKYLERCELPLVSALCRGRNTLMRIFPEGVREIRFLASIERGFRFPAAVFFIATMFYWVIGKFKTRGPRYVTKGRIAQLEPVVNMDRVQAGCEYSDAFLIDNDARFVFQFIKSAMNSGCCAVNYAQVYSAKYQSGAWKLKVKDCENDCNFRVKARILINAAGNHVDEFNQVAGITTTHRHVFSKGVHLIVKQLSLSNKVLTFFANDGRLFFAIPMGKRTCLGTTDTRVESPEFKVNDADREFILSNANRLLTLSKPLTTDDIVSERCGARPLAVKNTAADADWLALSRKHVIEVHSERFHISVFGGKLTDCLNIGDELRESVRVLLKQPRRPEKPWCERASEKVRVAYHAQAEDLGLGLLVQHGEPLSERYWRRYGHDAFRLLALFRERPELIQPIFSGSDFTQLELDLVRETEMITRLSDFLRRRTMIELVEGKAELVKREEMLTLCECFFGDNATEKLAEYLAEGRE